jgi:hypothetical protein
MRFCAPCHTCHSPHPLDTDAKHIGTEVGRLGFIAEEPSLILEIGFSGVFLDFTQSTLSQDKYFQMGL